jgi:hypothetical protein
MTATAKRQTLVAEAFMERPAPCLGLPMTRALTLRPFAKSANSALTFSRAGNRGVHRTFER